MKVGQYFAVFWSEKKCLKKLLKVINESLEGYLCSKSMFHLSKKVLKETEIRVLEKGLGFVLRPTKINQTDLRADILMNMLEKWGVSGFTVMSFQKALLKHLHSVLSWIETYLRETLL